MPVYRVIEKPGCWLVRPMESTSPSEHILPIYEAVCFCPGIGVLVGHLFLRGPNNKESPSFIV